MSSGKVFLRRLWDETGSLWSARQEEQLTREIREAMAKEMGFSPSLDASQFQRLLTPDSHACMGNPMAAAALPLRRGEPEPVTCRRRPRHEKRQQVYNAARARARAFAAAEARLEQNTALAVAAAKARVKKQKAARAEAKAAKVRLQKRNAASARSEYQRDMRLAARKAFQQERAACAADAQRPLTWQEKLQAEHEHYCRLQQQRGAVQ